jgi:hypothetical protein
LSRYRAHNLHILAVLEQAKENVSSTGTIRSLGIDRGFLDGKVLYAIHQQGIELVIPLKKNMEATIDARRLALETGDSFPARRDVEATHGYGEEKCTEKIDTERIGVPGLLTCDWFNPEGSNVNTSEFESIIPICLKTVRVFDRIL